MTFKSVMVTGDKGYIGSVLTSRLAERDYKITGFDTGYYAAQAIAPTFDDYPSINKDIRDVSASDLEGIEAIIHLAGLSNDPLGELAPQLTEQINYAATVRLATLAKAAGVKRFVYASSQSMYGIADDTKGELDEEAPKNPITAYARTKWDAELALLEMADDSFEVVCFRPSTVFGFSPRLRTDIVFNNLLCCAYTRGRIEIKSDGSPWRPVIHVQDVCSAFIAGLEAPAALIQKQSFNVGIRNVNYRVRDIAEAVHELLPDSELVFTGEHGNDSRTYRVCFNKINDELGDYYQPRWSLTDGGKDMLANFRKYGFSEADFTGVKTNRLNCLKSLLADSQLDESLTWR
ncbi:NAD-dependent epimerase/dehydratase family protein [Alteromonas sp. CYL-A6]|uniref:NAD-dependent epimerase/dehydratase family protein n=1 Tax=Alteromonas nitratireducens TaxID=3390813 RepID=UPI0034A9301B